MIADSRRLMHPVDESISVFHPPSCPHPFVPRMIVCNQVMKFILDKIEKDEKQAAKKRKKEEVVEQKRSRQNATKLTALLYKHKEQLKAEILKKRALLDKELQLQVQVRTQSAFNIVN